MVTPRRLSTSPKRCQRRNWFNGIAIALVVAGFILINQMSLNDFGATIDKSVEVKTPALRPSEAVHRAEDRVAPVPAVQPTEIVVQPEVKEEIQEPEKAKPAEHRPSEAQSKTVDVDQKSASVDITPKPADDKAAATDDTPNQKFEFISKLAYNFNAGETIVNNTAHSLQPVTDKVRGGEDGHNYEVMYGQFLLPFYATKPKMKLLEIGLGCDMVYGPGASAALWKKLFPEADLWVADANATCVERAKGNGMLDGFSTITGDQMKIEDLDKWIKESGGADFDVVIDNGGQMQCQIWTAFKKLWPLLKPGGLYFIEDLQVSRKPEFSNTAESPLCPKSTNVPDELMKILDAMIHRKAEEIGYGDVKFVFCQRDACVLGKHYDVDVVNQKEHSTPHNDTSFAQKIFLQAAFDEEPETDKVKWGHHYDIMYGQFLLPFYAAKPKMKFLEIGFGCDMSHGAGASVKVWQKLFPQAEIWEAELHVACIVTLELQKKLNGIKTLTGDQMDIRTLDKWIKQTRGGNFDVVIDDGGHKQCHIWTSFVKLWPLLKPGGLYFIEDLQVSRDPEYSDVESPICPKSTNVPDELKKIIDALLHRKEDSVNYKDVKFVFCQRDSCVLGKHP